MPGNAWRKYRLQAWQWYLGTRRCRVITWLPCRVCLSVRQRVALIFTSSCSQWMHEGRWDETQVIPEAWVREATRVNDDVLANEPEENHRYGLGFWCNDQGRIWSDLPRDSFAATGAGRQHVWVCPSLDLIVVRSPGIYSDADPAQGGMLLELVSAAVS